MELPGMTDVAGVLTQIATLQRMIIAPETSRPVKAYDAIPLTIAVAQCPCFVNFPKNLVENRLVGSDQSGREFWEIRNYALNLYHSSFGTGANEEKSGLLVPYFELVYALFGKYPHLNSLPGIVDAILTSDTGVGTATYVGNSYYAISFILKVTTRVRRPLSMSD